VRKVARWASVILVGTLSGAFFFGLAFALFKAAVYIAEQIIVRNASP